MRLFRKHLKHGKMIQNSKKPQEEVEVSRGIYVPTSKKLKTRFHMVFNLPQILEMVVALGFQLDELPGQPSGFPALIIEELDKRTGQIK